MEAIVESMNLGLSRECTDNIVLMADGFVRLARMLAHSLAKNPAQSTSDLLMIADARGLLERMLGNAADRQGLYVAALMSTVGWEGVLAKEGQAIAKHLGLEWAKVRMDVQRFHREYGIVPRAGDLRYVSPTPLAVMLAMEAMEVFRDEVGSLPRVMPSDRAREEHHKRVRAIARSAAGRDLAEGEIHLFSKLDRFRDPVALTRWAALAAANPVLAASLVREALENVSPEERALDRRVRRELVSAIADLVWPADSFHDAALALVYKHRVSPTPGPAGGDWFSWRAAPP
jgi:hypothetical protein